MERMLNKFWYFVFPVRLLYKRNCIQKLGLGQVVGELGFEKARGSRKYTASKRTPICKRKTNSNNNNNVCIHTHIVIHIQACQRKGSVNVTLVYITSMKC